MIVKTGCGSFYSTSSRCELERSLVTGMVERVLHVTQVNCRRKKKLVKIWHKPKPGEQHPTRAANEGTQSFHIHGEGSY